MFCDIFRNGSLVIEKKIQVSEFTCHKKFLLCSMNRIYNWYWERDCLQSAGWSQRICALFLGNDDKKQRLEKIIVSSTVQTQGKTQAEGSGDAWLYRNQGSRTEEPLHEIKIIWHPLNDEAHCVFLFFALRVLLDTSKRHKGNGWERNSEPNLAIKSWLLQLKLTQGL